MTTPPTKPDQWIEWKGGACPVSDDAKVIARLRVDNGPVNDDAVRAGDLRWSHMRGESNFVGYGDIIAYRIVEPSHDLPQGD